EVKPADGWRARRCPGTPCHRGLIQVEPNQWLLCVSLSGAVCCQLPVQYPRYLCSCQDDHPLREPPPAPATHERQLRNWTTIVRRCLIEASPPSRSPEGIERLMPRWTLAVLRQLAQIHYHLVEPSTGDCCRFQFELYGLSWPWGESADIDVFSTGRPPQSGLGAVAVGNVEARPMFKCLLWDRNGLGPKPNHRCPRLPGTPH